MRRASIGLALWVLGASGCVRPLWDWCLYSYSEEGLASLDDEFSCELQPLDDPIPEEVETCGGLYLLPEPNNFATNVKYDRFYAQNDLGLVAVKAFIDRDEPTWYGRRVNCESTCGFGADPDLPMCEEAE